MSTSFATTSYIAAIALFILSLSGLSQHATSRRGNLFGMIGMALALIATALLMQSNGYVPLIAALISGRDHRECTRISCCNDIYAGACRNAA